MSEYVYFIYSLTLFILLNRQQKCRTGILIWTITKSRGVKNNNRVSKTMK